MTLRKKQPKTCTPAQRLVELEREARGMDYEGWCQSMGIDYNKTGWARQIEDARALAQERHRADMERLKKISR